MKHSQINLINKSQEYKAESYKDKLTILKDCLRDIGLSVDSNFFREANFPPFDYDDLVLPEVISKSEEALVQARITFLLNQVNNHLEKISKENLERLVVFKDYKLGNDKIFGIEILEKACPSCKIPSEEEVNSPRFVKHPLGFRTRE